MNQKIVVGLLVGLMSCELQASCISQEMLSEIVRQLDIGESCKNRLGTLLSSCHYHKEVWRVNSEKASSFYDFLNESFVNSKELLFKAGLLYGDACAQDTIKDQASKIETLKGNMNF